MDLGPRTRNGTAKIDDKGQDFQEEREDREILLRWWNEHRDRVDGVDMDRVKDVDDALRLLKQYVESGLTHRERVVYV